MSACSYCHATAGSSYESWRMLTCVYCEDKRICHDCCSASLAQMGEFRIDPRCTACGYAVCADCARFCRPCAIEGKTDILCALCYLAEDESLDCVGCDKHIWITCKRHEADQCGLCYDEQVQICVDCDEECKMIPCGVCTLGDICPRCLDANNGLRMNEWLVVNPSCSKCHASVCEVCAWVCYSCAENDRSHAPVFCTQCKPDEMAVVWRGCGHFWITCGEHERACGACENEDRQRAGPTCADCGNVDAINICQGCESNMLCADCFDQDEHTLIGDICASQRCVECDRRLCRECIYICFDCPKDARLTYCEDCKPSGLQLVECKSHEWISCGKHGLGCGGCAAEDAYTDECGEGDDEDEGDGPLRCMCGGSVPDDEMYIRDWLVVDPTCSKCGDAICRSCIMCCYSCANEGKDFDVYCNTCAPDDMVEVDCEHHVWIVCAEHERKCGECKANCNYDSRMGM